MNWYCMYKSILQWKVLTGTAFRPCDLRTQIFFGLQPCLPFRTQPFIQYGFIQYECFFVVLIKVKTFIQFCYRGPFCWLMIRVFLVSLQYNIFFLSKFISLWPLIRNGEKKLFWFHRTKSSTSFPTLAASGIKSKAFSPQMESESTIVGLKQIYIER